METQGSRVVPLRPGPPHVCGEVYLTLPYLAAQSLRPVTKVMHVLGARLLRGQYRGSVGVGAVCWAYSLLWTRGRKSRPRCRAVTDVPPRLPSGGLRARTVAQILLPSRFGKSTSLTALPLCALWSVRRGVRTFSFFTVRGDGCRFEAAIAMGVWRGAGWPGWRSQESCGGTRLLAEPHSALFRLPMQAPQHLLQASPKWAQRALPPRCQREARPQRGRPPPYLRRLSAPPLSLPLRVAPPQSGLLPALAQPPPTPGAPPLAHLLLIQPAPEPELPRSSD